ncbi:MAG: ribosome silencing factor [Gammaproteobacteria bacterium]
MVQSIPTSVQAEATKKLTLKALEDLKANEITVLDVRQRANFTDYMIFASGTSSRHVKSIASAVIDAAKHAGQPPYGAEGEDVGEWVLVDLGDVIVHVMLPDTRQFYEIEKLWSEEPVLADSRQ